MKISETMQKAINIQIKNEFNNAFLYLSMSSWFEERNLQGFANWNFVQFQEEQTHAMKFYNYIFERQGSVSIEAVEKPKNKWNNPVEVFENILAAEIQTTKDIYKLYKIAQEENDYTSLGFLKWFLDEQIEEESSANKILEDLKQIGDSKTALLFLDKKLGERKFNN